MTGLISVSLATQIEVERGRLKKLDAAPTIKGKHYRFSHVSYIHPKQLVGIARKTIDDTIMS